MRTFFPLLGLLVVGAFAACVGDAPVVQSPADSGVADAGGGGDTSVPPTDSGMDAPGADSSDAARPVPTAKGDFNWDSVIKGGTESAIAYDALGNLFFTYYFYNSTIVDGKTYNSVGSADIMVVKYDGKGKVTWARQYGGAGDDECQDLVVDSSGDAYVLVVSNGTGFSFGGSGTYARKGTNYDGFIAKLSGANGDGIWVGDYTKSNENYLGCSKLAYGGGKLGLACFAYQGLALTKASDSTPLTLSCLDCGGSNPQYNDMYLASLDPATGKAYWGTVIGADNQTTPVGLGMDSKGAMVVSFSSFGTIVHDATNSVNWTYVGVKGSIAIVAKLAPSNGAGVWIKEFTDGTTNNNNQTEPGGIAFDSADNVVMGGQIYGTVPFGSFGLKSAGMADVFVTKLKSAFGDPIWARTFGGKLDDHQASVGVDPWDEVFVAGQYLSVDAKLDSFTFPAVPAPHGGFYIGKLDPGGNGLWATGIVSASTDVTPRPFNTLAVDSMSGDVAVVGWFTGTVDLGDGSPVTSPGGGVDDLFIVTHNP